MATDGVLVERDQQIKAIPHVGDRLRTGADRKKSVATPNDRLVRCQAQSLAPCRYFYGFQIQVGDRLAP